MKDEKDLAIYEEIFYHQPKMICGRLQVVKHYINNATGAFDLKWIDYEEFKKNEFKCGIY